MSRLVLRAPRLTVPALALGLFLAVPPAPASANGHGGDFVETVYAPTALVVPTSYSTTAYLPTAYAEVLYPTMYLSSVLSPTYYVEPTAYVVGSSRRSAWRPYYRTSRSYYAYDVTPTVYSSWVSTSYDVPLIAAPTTYTYADPCATTVAAPAASAPASSGSAVPPLNTRGGTAGTKPPSSVNSVPRDENLGAPARPADEVGTDTGLGTGTGEPPLEFPDRAVPDATDTTPGLQVPPVQSPPSGATAPDGSRTSYRPAPTDFRPSPSLPSLGAMRGVVLTGQATSESPTPNIKVVFSDLGQTYTDKSATSGADGLFEVVLPNGDWRVSIEDADGKLTPFGNITAANGRFYDERGRAVTSLRLHY
jgi:hypothetical protein